ncbi:conserved exported hypothetical protein [Imperialibacter sp. EC-SDR9]|nr:conserved exported hypothetical protein [Imperialibacter sp. 75]CAD5275135.1 conserved exported hypothetical protein [Imperialibacter sp. 89]VVT07953.1 conserved exported hypothetical protein [Imperialibacter sp. EC-SDR9]
MKTLAFIALLTLGLVDCFAQEEEVNIPWTPSYKLKWEDFQGPKNGPSWALATTCASIEVKSSYVDDSLTFRVTNNFITKLSFFDHTAIDRFGDSLSDLLSHEQLHFDIAELHTRIMRKSLLEVTSWDMFDLELYEARIESVYDLRNKMDSLYDRETANGLLKTNQDEWGNKLQSLLLELETFYESNEIAAPKQ